MKKMTFRICISGLYKTSMNFTFTHGSHPQDISLFICKYSQIKITAVKGYSARKETCNSQQTGSWKRLSALV